MTVLKYLFAVLVTLPILFLGVFLMKRYSIELRKTNQNVERKAVEHRLQEESKNGNDQSSAQIADKRKFKKNGTRDQNG